MHLLTRLSLNSLFLCLFLDFRTDAFLTVGKLSLPLRNAQLCSFTARPGRPAVQVGLR